MEDFAVRGDREALRKIWLACFGGEEEYVDFYLRRRFRPSETVVWREKGVPVSMMTLMNLEIAGRAGAYVYAVATLPEYRGRGLMRRLDAFAKQAVLARGGAFMALVPAEPPLFAMYEKLGYRTSFFLWEKEADAVPSRRRFGFSRCGFWDFARLRGEYLARFPGAAAHPLPELRYIYRELCRYDGGVFRWKEDGAALYAAFTRTSRGLWLRECSGPDPEAAACALAGELGCHHIRILCGQPFPGAVRVPYGMGRTLRPDGSTGPLEECFPGPFYMSLMLE